METLFGDLNTFWISNKLRKYRATKLVQDLQDCIYDTCSVELDFPSLKYQRQHGDIIMIYQFLDNYLNVDASDLLISNDSSITRGHNFKLFKPHTLTRVRSSFFYHKGYQ